MSLAVDVHDHVGGVAWSLARQVDCLLQPHQASWLDLGISTRKKVGVSHFVTSFILILLFHVCVCVCVSTVCLNNCIFLL